MIKEGSKVVFRKDSEFIGSYHNPDAGAIGVVVLVKPTGWIKVKWLHGTFRGRPIKEPFKNTYHEEDLKVIP